MRLTFRKEERLRHRRLVEDLFREGESLYDYPLRLVWRRLSDEALEESFRAGVPERVGRLQMLVTVPKRKRRHAVDRVLMRRRVREAYRLNRLPLKRYMEETTGAGNLGVAFVYISDRNVDYATVETKMRKLLAKLLAKVYKATTAPSDGPNAAKGSESSTSTSKP